MDRLLESNSSDMQDGGRIPKVQSAAREGLWLHAVGVQKVIHLFILIPSTHKQVAQDDRHASVFSDELERSGCCSASRVPTAGACVDFRFQSMHSSAGFLPMQYL